MQETTPNEVHVWKTIQLKQRLLTNGENNTRQSVSNKIIKIYLNKLLQWILSDLAQQNYNAHTVWGKFLQ